MQLSAADHERVSALLDVGALRREIARRSILDFGEYVDPTFVRNWFIDELGEALDRFIDAYIAGESPRLMIFAPPQHGKALELSTPIPTPRGWSRIVDLKPGDYVFDEKGQPTKVVAVSPIWRDRKVYKVSTGSGFSVIADEAHEWEAVLCRKRPALRKHTTEVIARPRKKRALVACAGILELPEIDLPIPPYTMGVWLGDGASAGGTIFGNANDIDYVRSRIECEGVETSDRKTPLTFGILGVGPKLVQIGIRAGEKVIPPEYLRGSIRQRRALLNGLIDTDGYVAPDGQVELCSTSRNLADGVQELVSSFGVKSRILEGRATLYGKDCGPKYRVMFYMADAAACPRKAANCRDAVKNPGHYIEAEPAGRADTVCIEVESRSHLFLAGRGMIPTCNSNMVSRMLPAYLVGKLPDVRVAQASYGADLAKELGSDVENITLTDEYMELYPGGGFASKGKILEEREKSKINRADQRKTLNGKGGVKWVGVGGPITGFSVDIGIIDDPFKDASEALSTARREAVWHWYRSTLRNRIQKGGGIIVMHTRWHVDDLAGRLLELEKDTGDAQWEVLSYKAIDDEDPRRPPEDEGALFPHRFDRPALDSLKVDSGSFWWSALYDQSPSIAGGGVFKSKWWKYWQVLPQLKWRGIYADTAMKTKERNDYTVFQYWGMGVDNHLYLIDQIRGKWEAPELLTHAKAFFSKWQEASKERDYVPLRYLKVEDKASGTGLIQQLEREGGIPVLPIQRNVDKAVRSAEGAPQIEAGNVYLPPDADWLSDYLMEFEAFTLDDSHLHDDQIDATLDAIFDAYAQGSMDYVAMMGGRKR